MIALYECEPVLLHMRQALGADLLEIWQDIKRGENIHGVLRRFDKWEDLFFKSKDYVVEEQFSYQEISRVVEPLDSARWKVSSVIERRLAEVFIQHRESECFCPFEYRQTNPSLYPNPDFLKAIENEDIYIGMEEKPGVFISGPTGSGKTRAAWKLVCSWLAGDALGLFDRHGKLKSQPAAAYSAKELKNLSAKVNQGNGAAIEEWESLLNDSRQLLFIDDLGQVKFTSGFAENLFELIESVSNSRRFFICTAQVSGDELVSRWITESPNSRDTAMAIMRRLNEHCTLIEIAPTNENTGRNDNQHEHNNHAKESRNNSRIEDRRILADRGAAV